MTVGELLGRISSRELTEWQAFFGIEPMPEDRADWRAGMLAAHFYNIQRGRGQRALKPSDFMPDWSTEHTDDQADDGGDREILGAVMLWNAALGGKDLRQ